jgi:hypothetical protein
MPERHEKDHHDGRWDLVGGIVSMVCAVHCLALPVLLPIAAAYIHSPWVEVGLMTAAILVGVRALRHGFRRHGFRLPLVLFSIGIASIIVGNWLLTGGTPLAAHSPEQHQAGMASIVTVALGALSILIAHSTNFIWERRWIRDHRT